MFADAVCKVLIDAIGDVELCILRESVGPLTQANFVLA
jgi:hypothetical protein